VECAINMNKTKETSKKKRSWERIAQKQKITSSSEDSQYVEL